MAADMVDHPASSATPRKIVPELREMVNSGSVDLLRNFSEACRAEFESLRLLS
jgi:hypothetical protein